MSNPADELAIRQLAAAYIDAVNRYHADDWIATWADDATWNLMGMEVAGKDNILNLWQGAMGGFEWVVMMLNSGTIEVDGDAATGRWYVTEHLNPKEGDANLTLGVYDDRYCKRDGKWLFAERRYHVLFQGQADYSLGQELLLLLIGGFQLLMLMQQMLVALFPVAFSAHLSVSPGAPKTGNTHPALSRRHDSAVEWNQAATRVSAISSGSSSST